MDLQIKEALNLYKIKLVEKKAGNIDINQLAGRIIDRSFPVNFWELSDRELDAEMGERLTDLNNRVDTKMIGYYDLPTNTFREKFVRKFRQAFYKCFRFYSDQISKIQSNYNGDLLAFHLATYVRLKQQQEQIVLLQAKLDECLEQQESLHMEVRRLKKGNH
jgi:hypothetical protein